MNYIKNFLHFIRVHTVIGTVLSVTALYLLALSFSDFSSLHLWAWILTLVSCLGANVYIVGLNQLTDIEIDRINKPWLPLASGEYSQRTGYALIIVSLLISLAIAVYLGKYLLLTVILSLALGTAYSLPPFRLKRFHFWAAFCIIAVRGLIVNLLLFLHFNDLINGLHNLPPVIWLLTATIFVYSIVIAWFKDIPDMEGDRKFQINTLSLRLGALSVFRAGNTLIVLTGFILIFLPVIFSFSLNTSFFASAHLALLLALLVAGRRVKLREASSVRKYYKFIWGLFFMEYIVFTAGALSN